MTLLVTASGRQAMSSISIPEEKVEQIRAMLRGRVRDLRVSPREGAVLLVGKASSYYAKQLAQHHVVKLLGVTVVVNEIEVQDGFMIGPICSGADDE
jgi:osmotically-inducible protein OsmY